MATGREREKTRVRGRERAFEESSEDEDGETDARRARFGSKERSVEGQVLSGELGAMRNVKAFSTDDRTSWIAVVVSFVNFTSFHAVREGYMACKSVLAEQLQYPTVLLGNIDFSFCFAYAVGLFFSGLIGRRLGVVRVIAFSYAATALLSIALGVVNGYIFSPQTSQEAWKVALVTHLPLWMASGLVQSLAYPNFIALLSANIEPCFRSTVLSIWAVASPVGDIVGLQIARAVLRAGDENWPMVMFASAGFVFLNLIAFLLFVAPNSRGIVDEEDAENALLIQSDEDTAPEPSFKEVITKVWKLPGVVDYAGSLMALKGVVTSLLFWIPFYVDERFGSHSNSIISTQLFDLSLIIGIGVSALLNRLLDRWIPLFMVSLILGIIPLTCIPYENNLEGTVACIFATGFFVGPAAALFASVMSAELASKTKEHRGHGGIVGVISGFVDSSGAVGSGVGQILVGVVASAYGWRVVFMMLTGFVILGTFCLVRMLRMENGNVR